MTSNNPGSASNYENFVLVAFHLLRRDYPYIYCGNLYRLFADFFEREEEEEKKEKA